ncbi:MAG TPA: acyl-CoA synthetase FdrA [bacterium]|nr:acyl-CoA synthetase FdrA [bacterium]
MLTTFVWRSFYQDSVVLMRLAATLRERPGVHDVAALMGTPANHDLLTQSGLATEEAATAGPEDLMLVLSADNAASSETALEAGRAFLSQRREAAAEAEAVQPRSLDAALALLPDANLATISVPGAYARFEAMRALQRGLHVFLFSDNVPLADELALKQEALERGLLMMGPDCGTAYLGGVGLGFYNRVPRGRVGCVAASGTGLQAVACHLATLGEGLSHAIGVGGRDLSAEVGGLMTLAALQALAQDAATEVIVLISKPPHPGVLPRLQATLAELRKPVVVCCLGTVPDAAAESGTWVATLEDAAAATFAALHGEAWTPRPFTDAAAVRECLAAVRSRVPSTGSAVVGLFTGGTLAHEARLLLQPHLGPVAFNPPPDAGGHRVLDLGDDTYTVGRAHPMIDPLVRTQALARALADPATAAVLLDVVLGVGAHDEPAAPVAAAVRAARARAGQAGLAPVVASVLGTEADPQGLATQTALLRDAGVEVLPTNAQAARFAAAIVHPTAAAALLGET